MQNRLVLSNLHSSVSSLQNATDTLRNLVEEHGCWVDRFAFLPRDHANGTTTAAAELHIENLRDKAVKYLNGLFVILDSDGNMYSSHKDFIIENGSKGNNDDDRNSADSTKLVSFTIRAAAATPEQSKILVECCPLDDELEDVEAKEKMKKQSLVFPNAVELLVQSSNEGGGTGSVPWRGGFILSQHICLWLGNNSIHKKDVELLEGQESAPFSLRPQMLFQNKSVLELGAGSSGLPSMALAKICSKMKIAIDLITSDGVDEIVTALKRNISANNLDDVVHVKHINWNDASSRHQENTLDVVDTIIFADCVYNEEGGSALCNAINLLLKPGGNVIGVLPDFRVGIDSFEASMKNKGFIAAAIPRLEKDNRVSEDFACAGGGGKNYRLMWWRDCRTGTVCD